MRILFLTFYFPPDLSAGSFRSSALVWELSKLVNSSGEIEVLTTAPNRYKGFAASAPEEEEGGNVRIRRFRLSSHRSGMIDQGMAFSGYLRRVLKHVRRRKYDLVFATSSRLMTAMAAAIVVRRSGCPLYLDIRDIFTETIDNLFAGRAQRVVVPGFQKLEKWVIESATYVNVVSPGFLDYFARYLPTEELRTFTNGIDEEFLDYDFEQDSRAPQQPMILYAGNIGDGQGLHRIIPQASKALRGLARFVVIGEGGRRQQLQESLAAAGTENVELIAPVPRSQLLTWYKRADVLFLHLNDHPAFRRVLPSKIFEYGATGKPILAGVAGYARKFIQEEVVNASCFDPCDASGMVRALTGLHLGQSDRESFINRYRRTEVVRQMAQDILAAARCSRT